MRFARLAGVGIIVGPSFGAPTTRPAVTLVDASPVVIAGSGYTAGAKFFVTYRSGAVQIRRHVVATLAGRYRVVLKGVTFERCNGLQLTAPGASLRVPACTAGSKLVLSALTLVYGTVRIGPVTPVCKQGVPCDKPAAHVKLTFTHLRTRRQVTTDARGRYHLSLARGAWTAKASTGMGMRPLRIVVPRLATWRRNFLIDTGIR